MPSAIVDGHDFFAVYEAAGEAIQRARSGGGPSLIEVKVNRYFGHFEGDQQTYRGADEVKKLRETKDCLLLFRGRVTKQNLLTEEELNQIDEEVKNEVEDAVAFSKQAPKPQPSDLLTDVYVAYA
jgi:pyruvate dehydrogenase E1 component alpha subunit